jgi:hypothetical protein
MTATANSRPFAVLLLAGTLLLSGGCFNESQATKVHLGTVSLGQQLMDLQKARDEDAISDAEFRKLRRKIIAAIDAIELEDDDDDDRDEDEAPSEDDEFNWF